MFACAFSHGNMEVRSCAGSENLSFNDDESCMMHNTHVKERCYSFKLLLLIVYYFLLASGLYSVERWRTDC
jgi:hypothetical protein